MIGYLTDFAAALPGAFAAALPSYLVGWLSAGRCGSGAIYGCCMGAACASGSFGIVGGIIFGVIAGGVIGSYERWRDEHGAASSSESR